MLFQICALKLQWDIKHLKEFEQRLNTHPSICPCISCDVILPILDWVELGWKYLLSS